MLAMESRVVWRKIGMNIREIGTIFITHHHDDHTAGLGTLLSVVWDSTSHQANQCLRPAQDGSGWSRRLCSISPLAPRSGLQTRTHGADTQVLFGHDVGTGVIYQDVNIKVTAVENSHFDFHKGLEFRQVQVLFLSF